jgi:hypothetical protein
MGSDHKSDKSGTIKKKALATDEAQIERRSIDERSGDFGVLRLDGALDPAKEEP